ncbi:hypothetical protein HMI54_001860 [Coelomomyces lativittatus]|nr:hypothetical protein HMI56_003056 [Coelomomyces lativittatus]KAJ1505177.1 hypothetical protein HMI55_001711 [Coelomomyces lativittatus]KAJ1510113.1 hypothetical protein HMI54_001860 [Coelomomyces lativittatus]
MNFISSIFPCKPTITQPSRPPSSSSSLPSSPFKLVRFSGTPPTVIWVHSNEDYTREPSVVYPLTFHEATELLHYRSLLQEQHLSLVRNQTCTCGLLLHLN